MFNIIPQNAGKDTLEQGVCWNVIAQITSFAPKIPACVTNAHWDTQATTVKVGLLLKYPLYFTRELYC